MSSRPRPIHFWSYPIRAATGGASRPYIDPKLQEGTTPLVKMMAGRFTRNFRNVHHTKITDRDYEGPRVILDNRYKLVVDAGAGSGTELFDLRDDPAEKNNLAETEPETVRKLQDQLRAWQQSVLVSLTGADY